MNIVNLFIYQPGQPLLFSSGAFFVLFLAFYGVYVLVQNQIMLRMAWVLLFSMFFYYKASGAYLLVLLASIVLDYFAAIQIFNQKSRNRRRAWLLLSLCGNLGILFYFKYTNFLLSSFYHLWGRDFTALDIVLPVGVSFFTFQSLSYTVDIYRKELKPADTLLDYAFFATFFPQLVAGPIVRARHFLPQIRSRLRLSPEAFGRAWFLILAGLFKKAIISDYISSNFVDRIFDNPGLYSGLENLMASYGYALQIYCDFSGYSDMAIGLALLMGFELPPNFNSPYQAISLTDFWRRWHISLSSWLRDYLYIPLGGNRKGKVRTYLNLMLTMLLGGLWHGASWKFVAWGGLHGVGLAVEKALDIKSESFKFLRRLFVFHLVCLGWIYFRAADFNTGSMVLERIFSGVEISHIGELVAAYPGVFALMLLGFVLHFTPKSMDAWVQASLTKASPLLKAFILAALVWFVMQIKSAAIQPFIYFQF
jgi:alginate O-acetyltransferase complex protein AlgI